MTVPGLQRTQAGRNGQGGRLFRLAASECPKGFNEWAAAKAEIKALGGKA